MFILYGTTCNYSTWLLMGLMVFMYVIGFNWFNNPTQKLNSPSCNLYNSCVECVKSNIRSNNCRWSTKNSACQSLSQSKNEEGSIFDIYLCPNYAPEFDQIKARKAFDFAAAAYSDNPERCLQTGRGSYSVVKAWEFYCEEETKCFVYIAVSKFEKTIVISYRGTETWRQLIVEGQSIYLFHKDCPNSGKIYSYFYNGVRNSIDNITEELKKWIDSNNTYEIIFTGHSLGGALATLLSVLLRNEKVIPDSYMSKVFLFTFGNPRIGNYDFAMAQALYVKNSFRVVHKKDIVPHIPECAPLGQKNCEGPNDKSYPYHHGIEIFYDNYMNNISQYSICMKNEDINCSKKNRPSFESYNNHINYYDLRVSEYGVDGCPRRIFTDYFLDENPFIQGNNISHNTTSSNEKSNTKDFITANETCIDLSDLFK